MVNEDANAKLIRELKEEIQKLRELLKAEGIEIHEGWYCVLLLNIKLNKIKEFLMCGLQENLILIKQ